MTLDQEIEAMEQRVLNARSIEAARAFHDRLDVLRERRGARPTFVTEYQRGYQAGYHKGIRGQKMTELTIAADDDEIVIREKVRAILDPLPQESRERVIKALWEQIDFIEAEAVAARIVAQTA